MSETLPPTITVFVNPYGPLVRRPFGRHPAFATLVSLAAFVLLALVASLTGAGDWSVVVCNLLAITVPAALLCWCYNRNGNILRVHRQWEQEFIAGMRLAAGRGAQIVNQHEFMLSLHVRNPACARIALGGVVKTYSVAMNDEEVVMFNYRDLDREWEQINARQHF